MSETMKVLFSFFILLAFFATQDMARGELYRWVDETGVVHFTETPPEKADSAVKVDPASDGADTDQDAEEAGIESAKREVDSGEEAHGTVNSEEAPAHEVELYVTSWCVYCRMAADYLRSRGIPFKSYDIEKDREAAIRRIELDPRSGGVPFAVINGFRIRGFSVQAYEKALAREAETP